MAKTAQVSTRGELLWSGEHWIAYLKSARANRPTAMVSLYHAYTSPAGRGTAAFVQIEGELGHQALCTDNSAFAEFVKQTQLTPAAPFDVEMPLCRARFQQTGDIRGRPSWQISVDSRQIETSWWDLHQPLVGPPTANPRIVFTILVFADSAAIELDGVAVEGNPYPRDIWANSLGSPMSSCVFALSETMVL